MKVPNSETFTKNISFLHCQIQICQNEVIDNAYFFILPKSCFNQCNLLSEYKDQKHTGILGCKLHNNWSEIKFCGLILHKNHIFVAFYWVFASISKKCYLWYLELYWPGHNFETNVNLAIKFSLKIENYEGLLGEKFRNQWCLVSNSADRKRQYVFWYVNYTSVTWSTQ